MRGVGIDIWRSKAVVEAWQSEPTLDNVQLCPAQRPAREAGHVGDERCALEDRAITAADAQTRLRIVMSRQLASLVPPRLPVFDLQAMMWVFRESNFVRGTLVLRGTSRLAPSVLDAALISGFPIMNRVFRYANAVHIFSHLLLDFAFLLPNEARALNCGVQTIGVRDAENRQMCARTLQTLLERFYAAHVPPDKIFYVLDYAEREKNNSPLFWVRDYLVDHPNITRFVPKYSLKNTAPPRRGVLRCAEDMFIYDPAEDPGYDTPELYLLAGDSPAMIGSTTILLLQREDRCTALELLKKDSASQMGLGDFEQAVVLAAKYGFFEVLKELRTLPQAADVRLSALEQALDGATRTINYAPCVASVLAFPKASGLSIGHLIATNERLCHLEMEMGHDMINPIVANMLYEGMTRLGLDDRAYDAIVSECDGWGMEFTSALSSGLFVRVRRLLSSAQQSAKRDADLLDKPTA